MANEYFKVTQIFKRFRKGLRQYPFSIGSFLSVVAGGVETELGSGIVPDGTSIYVEKGVPFSDEHDAPELSRNSHINPPFINDESLGTGLRENV